MLGAPKGGYSFQARLGTVAPVLRQARLARSIARVTQPHWHAARGVSVRRWLAHLCGPLQVGMANLFLLHTSASLTINENASPDVPLDLNDALEKLAPEGGSPNT